LGRQHGRQSFSKRLKAIERAVTTDADQSVDVQTFQTVRNDIEFVGSFRIDVITRRTDERAALGWIEFRNFLEQGIQMHVRHSRIEQAVEALDQSIHLDSQL